MRRVALSTIDNPHSPIKDYPLWFAFDERKGYGTASFLARVVNSTEALGHTLHQDAIEAAIDEIVEENLLGLYIKVVDDGEETQTVVKMGEHFSS